MSVEAIVVSRFAGLDRRGQTGRTSTRRQLDRASEMYNFHITDEGFLHMPAAAAVFYQFAAGAEILSIHYVETPRGIVVQLADGSIYHFGIDPNTSELIEPPAPVLLATIPAAENGGWKVWTNSTGQGYFLMGYAPRGSAGSDGDGRTWKVDGTHDAPTTTDISATVEVNASYSTLFKGRRFWARRARQVYFSPLNAYDQPATAETTFTISGDDVGNTFVDRPGNLSGMVSWEDVLIFFLNGSVWSLAGGSPETFRLQQVQTIVGNAFNEAWALVRTDDGVLTYGGGNLNAPGVYLFTGANATKVSEPINDWMRSRGRLFATVSGNAYVLASSRANADERQFLIYSLTNGTWVAFDGFVYGVATVRGGEVFIGSEETVYLTSNAVFPRAPGRAARIVLGYQDDQNPSGLARYLALKISGQKWGAGAVTVQATVRTGDTSKTSEIIDLPTDVFDNVVIPLGVRGPAAEIELTITPASDDNEVLIENLQLVASRKGEKVSRA